MPRIGIGGPVGSGKTALVAALCRALSGELTIGVVTNDIYTTEDADFLRRAGVLPDARIRAVQTGACPHTAIRDDISANLDAVEKLEADHPGLELILVESGGDNLTATFSYGLVHRQIFVIDVAGGDKVPRKGGPGVTRSDLLVINKTDLAPLVGADLAVMARDAAAVRGDRPTVFTSLVADPAATEVAAWVRAVRSAVAAARGRVIARTTAVVEPGGVLGELACAPPLTLRQVHGDGRAGASCAWSGPRPARWRATTCRSACSCGPGARATLRATGASLAQGRAAAGRGGALSIRADLAERRRPGRRPGRADRLPGQPGGCPPRAGAGRGRGGRLARADRARPHRGTARAGHPALGRDPARPRRCCASSSTWTRMAGGPG